MPRRARAVSEGLPHHVTQRGIDGVDVFHSDQDRLVYLTLVASHLKEVDAQVLAYCLMTNHVHWIITPGEPQSLALLFRRVHGRYAQYFNTVYQRRGHLWQNRYFSCTLGAQHLVAALRYVEWNPIRAGICREAAEYPWSSATDHLRGPGQERTALLDWTYWRECGGAAAWRELIESTEDVRQSQDLRRCTYAGRPWGTEDFVKTIETQHGRHWRIPGRPQGKAAIETKAGQSTPTQCRSIPK